MLLQLFEYFMIMPTAFILQGIFTIMPPINFLTTSTAGIQIANAFTWFFGKMMALDPIFPYTNQLIILNVIMTFYATLFTIKLVTWIAKKIPFVSLS